MEVGYIRYRIYMRFSMDRFVCGLSDGESDY